MPVFCSPLNQERYPLLPELKNVIVSSLTSLLFIFRNTLMWMSRARIPIRYHNYMFSSIRVTKILTMELTAKEPS